jgi:hypothetical protein
LTKAKYLDNIKHYFFQEEVRMDFQRFLRIFLTVTLFIPVAAYGAVNISKTGARSGYPAVAVNQEGVILAVWPEQGDEAGVLWYNVFKNGQWSGAKNANITRLQAWSPQLDVDSDGYFHIAYADGNSRFNREVYHAVYDSGKNEWSVPEMIFLSEENSAWQKIDIEGERVYIVWHHENADPYLGHDIVMQSKLKGEQYWPSAYERLVWTANDNSTHPAFKVLDDKIYVVYMEGIGDSGPWRLFYKEAKRGSAWAGVPKFEIIGNAYRPELEVDDNGNAHVVYATKSGNFMYRSKINGVWKNNESISSKFSPQQFGDLRYKNHVLVATWVQYDDSGMSAYYAKKVIGSEWEKPVQIHPGSDALYPRVWIDDNGYGHFVWRDHGDIFYEKIAVPPAEPFLQLEPRSLSFVVEGTNPDPESFVVKNVGQKSLNFNVKTQQSWMTVSPQNGSLKQNQEQDILVTIDAADLDEGSHTGTIEISSNQALNSPQTVTVNLEVLAPPIYPPLNFSGELLENKALFYREYMHHLTWEANPQNKKIENYRLYEVDGVNYIFLEEFSSSTFEYTRRHILKDKAYTYELWAVDDKGRTGNQPAVVAMNAALAAQEKDQLRKNYNSNK